LDPPFPTGLADATDRAIFYGQDADKQRPLGRLRPPSPEKIADAVTAFVEQRVGP